MTTSRRTILGALMGMAGIAHARSGVKVRSRVLDYDPRKNAEGTIKIIANLDTSKMSAWWYDMTVYAIVEATTPRLLLHAEGCETYSVRREADGGYRVRNHTVTNFKDAITGEWLDSFDNPFTGHRNIVRPNLIQGGATIFGADGITVWRDNSDMQKSEIGPAGDMRQKTVRVGSIRWTELGNQICWIREGIAAGSYQPLMEISSNWVDRAALFNPALTSVDGVFGSTFLSPWLGWMDMNGVPGHLMWHSTGKKLSSLDALPASYRQRAEKLAPGILAADPFS